MSEPVKLCKDCRFMVVDHVSTHPKCDHPNNVTVNEDLVMGLHTKQYQFTCTMLRGVSDKCGPTGSWFAPKGDYEPAIDMPTTTPTPLRKSWSFPHMSLMSWLVLLAAEFYVIVESLRLGLWLMNQPNDAAVVVGMLVMCLFPVGALGLGATATRKFLVTKDK